MINKPQLHPRNLHKHGYDFDALTMSFSPLKKFLQVTKFDTVSIDYSDAKAVKALNSALMAHHYKVQHWDFPDTALCPPIPGRVDYLHYLADLLKQSNGNKPAPGQKVTVLDIGTGASCVYPILGSRVYQWQFVATDINPSSVLSAQKNVDANPNLPSSIECRLQNNSDNILTGVINENDKFDLTLCNPPFHSSQQDAEKGSLRKWQNLNKQKDHKGSSLEKHSSAKVNLNFAGENAELFCQGGELTFIKTMIKESKTFKNNVLWFSCLVSKKDNLKTLKFALTKAKVSQFEVIQMAQGNKISRFIAWTFKDSQAQLQWCEQRFSKNKI